METPKEHLMPLLDYEIYEVLPSGSMTQRGSANGLEAAWQKLSDIAKRTANECFAIHPPTRQVVAQLNVPPAEERGRKHVFQIAYTEEMGLARAEELTRRGYHVITVIGNERARIVLSTAQRCDLFIIGHAAPDQARASMVAWLKANYPTVKILALNPVFGRLREADYNVILNGPEKWIPIVAKATEKTP
jgi:hypothetical protein